MQVLMSGLAMGSMWGLVALGLVITWTSTRTLNFAQGEFVSFGALISASFLAASHYSVVVSWVILAPVLLIVGAGAGALMYIFVIDKIDGEEAGRWIVATVAISVLLVTLGQHLWGPHPRSVPSIVGERIIRIGDSGFMLHQLVVATIGITSLLALDQFIRHSRTGRSLRAVAEDRFAAELCGVPTRKVGTQAYALAGAISALVGLLVGPIAYASPGMGAHLLIGGFAVAILGGITSMRGLLLAAPLFGIVDALIRNAGANGPNYASVFGLMVIVVVLAFRPAGLFGKKELTKA